MSNKHDATVEEFIFRSLGHIEQGRLQHFEIHYFIGDRQIQIEIHGWKKRKEEYD